MDLTRLALGVLLGAGVAAAAWAAGALTLRGAGAAAAVGGLTFGVGGLAPALLLLAFFLSSSALSRLGAARKRALAARFAKGGRRDEGQVLANGGLAALCAVLHGLTLADSWLVAMAGALAAVNADTWATELGVLARRRPRLILGWQPVEPGTSGAVSPEGSLAAIGGAALLGLVAGVLAGGVPAFVAALAGGVAGAFFDSLLGASVQAIYRCPACEAETERTPVHTCGAETRHQRGWRWLGNDGVNFLASALGAATALLGWLLL